jgi:hypothetical protein
LIEMDAEGILPPYWLIISGFLLSGLLIYWYYNKYPPNSGARNDV